MMHALALVLTVLAILVCPPILVCLGVILLMSVTGSHNDDH